jgi:hypothetical protein
MSAFLAEEYDAKEHRQLGNFRRHFLTSPSSTALTSSVRAPKTDQPTIGAIDEAFRVQGLPTPRTAADYHRRAKSAQVPAQWWNRDFVVFLSDRARST